MSGDSNMPQEVVDAARILFAIAHLHGLAPVVFFALNQAAVPVAIFHGNFQQADADYIGNLIGDALEDLADPQPS